MNINSNVNWGGYYEVVKNCMNEFSWKNIVELDSVFSILENLENTKDFREIHEIRKKISKEEQDKLNSPVLDSILKCKSFIEVVQDGNLEAVKFLYDRKGAYVRGYLNVALENCYREIVDFFIEKKVKENAFEYYTLNAKNVSKSIILKGDIDFLKYFEKEFNFNFPISYLLDYNFSKRFVYKKELFEHVYEKNPSGYKNFINFIRKHEVITHDLIFEFFINEYRVPDELRNITYNLPVFYLVNSQF